jgi:hypothetical protein
MRAGAPVVLGPGDALDSQQNLRLRPLRPGEGRFLPVVATLGGALFLEPFGCVAAGLCVFDMRGLPVHAAPLIGPCRAGAHPWQTSHSKHKA